MNRVMATGVFDLLHLGHIHYLRESKSLGDYMIVVVATDEMARKNGKELIFSEDYRRNMVSSIRYVDDAIIGNQGDIYKTVEQIKPDIITLGFDQSFNEKIIEEECLKRGLKVKVIRCSKFNSAEPTGTRYIKQKIMESKVIRN